VDALRGADLILHAGDLSAVSMLEELRALGPPVRAVYGNADEPALRETLPRELVVEAEAARIGMVHIPGPAAGREERLVRRFADCDAVHPPLPLSARHGRVWLLNPGSPTERRRGPARSFLLLRVTGRRIRPRLVELPA
jgi:hypothetical protein